MTGTSDVPIDLRPFPGAARRYEAVRAARVAREEAEELRRVEAWADGRPSASPWPCPWSVPVLRDACRRRGRLPCDEDGGGAGWDDAVRVLER